MTRSVAMTVSFIAATARGAMDAVVFPMPQIQVQPDLNGGLPMV